MRIDFASWPVIFAPSSSLRFVVSSLRTIALPVRITRLDIPSPNRSGVTSSPCW